jgi:hypothetical protein
MRNQNRQVIGFPTAEVAAATDLAAVIGYIVDVAPAPFQAAAIAVKIALVLVSRNRLSGMIGGAVPLMVLIGAAGISTIFSHYYVLQGLGQYVLVALNVSSTLILLRATNFHRYTRALGILSSGINVLFGMMALAGHIPDHFGGSHPNLGSEIAAIGVISLCMTFSLKPAHVVALSIPNLVACFLMQGRTGLLVIVFAVLIRLYLSVRGRGMNYVLGLVTLLLIMVPIGTLLGGRAIRADVSEVLLLEDSHRGIGTGFVGRDGRWKGGIDMFLSSPLTGGGPDVFRSEAMLSPHNWFMYGIGELGALFLLVLFFMIRCVVRAYRYNSAYVLVLSPVLLLMMLNDRFMNLNAYPTLMYVFLFALASWRIVLPTNPAFIATEFNARN